MDHPCAFVKVDPVFFSQPYHHFTSLSFILLKTLLTKKQEKEINGKCLSNIYHALHVFIRIYCIV